MKRLIDELVIGNTLTIGLQAFVSILINVIIETMHKFTYNADSGIDKDVFAVKTHRILELSNIISSTSNIIFSAIGAISGICAANGTLVMHSLEQLDIGGLLVTIHRIATDENFINNVKMEYLKKHWCNYVTQSLEEL